MQLMQRPGKKRGRQVVERGRVSGRAHVRLVGAQAGLRLPYLWALKGVAVQGGEVVCVLRVRGRAGAPQSSRRQAWHTPHEARRRRLAA